MPRKDPVVEPDSGSHPSRHSRRTRSRSPGHHANHKHRRYRDEADAGRRNENARPRTSMSALPFRARPLTKNDYSIYRSVFARYLELQKQIYLDHLDPAESKGRWKSFIKKWNQGDLAEGWYDPSRLQRLPSPRLPSKEPEEKRREPQKSLDQVYETLSSSDDDGPGPYMLEDPRTSRRPNGRSGPSIPTMQDIELKRELENDEVREARQDNRRERKAERTLQKERLEELVPRAMPGTRERQLEKRREVSSANRAYADAKSGGAVEEVNDNDLMGGGDDSVDSYKKKLTEVERQKNERELRRDEIARARREERQQRAREIQEREDRTMQGLLELAKQRFG